VLFSNFSRTYGNLSVSTSLCKQLQADSIACEELLYWRMGQISIAVYTVLAFRGRALPIH
jgi:hypothetical protein